MQNQRILTWEEFRYLNGVRRNSLYAQLKYEEYLSGLLDFQIVAENGKIKDKMTKVLECIEDLNNSLLEMVKKERVKDITLLLEDLD